VDVVVVGAGLSGLVCAWRLVESGIDAVCLEATDRVGGALRTHRRDGFVAEAGATTVQENPELAQLIRDLSLEREVRRTDPKLARFVYRGGMLHRLPRSLVEMVTTPVVSTGGKLRILGEVAIGARRDGSEESVAQFITRRFGVETLDALVAPFVSGTFAGDSSKLSASAAFPRLVELERKSGSVLRAFLGGGARPRTSGALVTFRDGLETLAERIAERLGDRLRRGAPVTSLASISASHVVLAVPAWTAADLLREAAPESSAALAEFEAPRLACVSLSWDASDVAHPLDGFGFLVAPGESVRILGCLWPSSMFEGRAPAGRVLLTSFVGGARDPGGAELDDRSLVATVAADLARILGARGEPRVVAIDRYERSIPQYTIGHRARVARVVAGLAKTPRISLCGNYFDGISVGECVRKGLLTAVDLSRRGV